MSGTQPSNEVAEDYAENLELLTTNDRYAINNLTVIAKENTEHADTISKVLEEHIRKVPPNHKLPALYVLDSIAKNIGTPYTLFLGHNLYQTFIDAYSLVDNQIRKKLDEMLKTWKNPVPGSRDQRPVFPPEYTRRIETALIQAKTSALNVQKQQHQSQQEMMRRRAPAVAPTTQWRDTPTPPQNGQLYSAPPMQVYQSVPINGNIQGQSQYVPYSQSSYPSNSQFPTPQPNPSPYQPPAHPVNPYQIQTQQPSNVASLLQDTDDLILTAKAEFASNPYDKAVQTRLSALLNLQTILKTQQLPPHQIQQVRDQLVQLKSVPRLSTPAITPVVPAIAPPVQHTYQTQAPPQPSITPLPSAGSLADLLASAARSKQGPLLPPSQLSVAPSLPMQQTPYQVSQPPVTSAIPLPTSTSSLLDSLRAAGLLTGSTPANGLPVSSQAHLPYYHHPTTTSTPPLNFSHLVKPATQERRNGIELTSASLKIPRLHLIAKLYEVRPNQCSSCGKRFFATEDGRTKKARHLDWHFRTNQRLADSAKRGQSRSWYVDEMEWIKSRENVEEGFDGSSEGGKDAKVSSTANAVKNDPQSKFIPVPSDSALASLPCPICREKFETSWNTEAQDFVWMDAIQIGSRVFHATCHAELKKDGGNTPLRASTPDSVLGKRKAEPSSNDPTPIKVKKEIA